MELAHPAGADALPPQSAQLASAVASTKKSLLANFAQPRWSSPAESECHPGCQKDQKKCSRPCATGASQLLAERKRDERQDDDASRRAASCLRIQQDYWSGSLGGRGMVSTSS